MSRRLLRGLFSGITALLQHKNQPKGEGPPPFVTYDLRQLPKEEVTFEGTDPDESPVEYPDDEIDVKDLPSPGELTRAL